MENQIIETVYDNHNFIGYLAIDAEGNILFGYDADWAQKDGWSLDGESRTGYMLYSFEDEWHARDWLAEQNFR